MVRPDILHTWTFFAQDEFAVLGEKIFGCGRGIKVIFFLQIFTPKPPSGSIYNEIKNSTQV